MARAVQVTQHNIVTKQKGVQVARVVKEILLGGVMKGWSDEAQFLYRRNALAKKAYTHMLLLRTVHVFYAWHHFSSFKSTVSCLPIALCQVFHPLEMV